MPTSPKPTLHLYDFQAFECTNCGRCCKPWRVNIDPHQMAEIMATQAYQTRARPGYLPLELQPDGMARLGSQPDNDACIFLDHGNLCSIHAEVGGSGKPLGCQLYPYQTTDTPDGTFLQLSFGCPPVVAGLDRDVDANRVQLTQALAYRGDRPEDTEDNPFLVRLSQEREISWASYLLLEERVLSGHDPLDSVNSILRIILSLQRLLAQRSPDGALSEWPTLGVVREDTSFAKEMMTKYLSSIITVLEDVADPVARQKFGDNVESGRPVYSRRFEMELPPLDIDGTDSAWVSETYERYFRNAVLGKSLLKSTVLSRLLALASGPILTRYYAQGFRQQRKAAEVDLAALTDAFELVEVNVVTHTRSLEQYFSQMETTFAQIAACPIEMLAEQA